MQSSGLHARGPTSYVLREGGVDHPMNKSPLVVGRGSDADIVLFGSLVSRRHAEFHETEAGIVVIDLDSRNGVFVNGSPISSPTALLIGDKLTIGDNVFVLNELPALRQEEPTPGPDLKAIRESG